MADQEQEEDEEDDDTIVGAMMDPTAELHVVFNDLETLLKNGDVVGALTLREINASLALLAVQALRAYLADRKVEAAEDFATVSEEIRARLALSSGGGPGTGRRA
jgi:hypothetical protein